METIILTILSLLTSLQIVLAQIQESLLPESILGAVTELDSLEGIQQAEEAYFQKNGKYLQIIPDSRLPFYERGTVNEKLGKDLAQGWRVDVYETPKKERGYDISWTDLTGFHIRGFGPEALARTSDRLVDNTASTTSFLPNLLQIFPISWFLNTAWALSENTNSADFELDSSQYYSITDAAQTGLDFSDTFTFAVWIRYESHPAASQAFITKRTGIGNNRSYEWIWDSSDVLQITTWTDGATTGCAGPTVAWNPSLDTWYHAAVTKSGTVLKFYIDGSQQGADQSCGNATIFDGTSIVSIGARQDTGSGLTAPVDGLMDDMRVWSRALTPTEISDLKTDPCNFDNATSTVSQWLFDVGGDDSVGVNDLTNNNTTGTSTTVAYTCAGAAAAPAVNTQIIWLE